MKAFAVICFHNYDHEMKQQSHLRLVHCMIAFTSRLRMFLSDWNKARLGELAPHGKRNLTSIKYSHFHRNGNTFLPAHLTCSFPNSLAPESGWLFYSTATSACNGPNAPMYSGRRWMCIYYTWLTLMAATIVFEKHLWKPDPLFQMAGPPVTHGRDPGRHAHSRTAEGGREGRSRASVLQIYQSWAKLLLGQTTFR